MLHRYVRSLCMFGPGWAIVKGEHVNCKDEVTWALKTVAWSQLTAVQIVVLRLRTASVYTKTAQCVLCRRQVGLALRNSKVTNV